MEEAIQQNSHDLETRVGGRRGLDISCMADCGQSALMTCLTAFFSFYILFYFYRRDFVHRQSHTHTQNIPTNLTCIHIQGWPSRIHNFWMLAANCVWPDWQLLPLRKVLFVTDLDFKYRLIKRLLTASYVFVSSFVQKVCCRCPALELR